ncbi:MAG: hypothetical protein HOP03_13670 [Lysobacter sp.]|nr:hypothetical protein [Lysobacter sp.]
MNLRIVIILLISIRCFVAAADVSAMALGERDAGSDHSIVDVLNRGYK